MKANPGGNLDPAHVFGRDPLIGQILDVLEVQSVLIDADRLNPAVLDSYVTAVTQRVAKIPQFELPLRLFRYGIRYLKSKKATELARIIHVGRTEIA